VNRFKKFLKVLAIGYLIWLALFSVLIIPSWAKEITSFKLNNGGSVVAQLDTKIFAFYGLVLDRSNDFASVSLKKANEDLRFNYYWGPRATERARKTFNGYKESYPPHKYPEFISLIRTDKDWAIFVGNKGGAEFKNESRFFFERQFNPQNRIINPSAEYNFYKNYTFNSYFNPRRMADYAPVIIVYDFIFLLNLPILFFLYLNSFLLAYLPPIGWLVYSSMILAILFYFAILMLALWGLRKWT